MKGAWYVGRVRGIPIRIHWSFILILAWSAHIGYGYGGWDMVGFCLLLTILLFGCVLLHELGHALTAQLFGIGTRSITLLPIGGVAALDRIPERPREEFLITLAGPMVNVVIAGVLYLFAGWPTFDFDDNAIWNAAAIGEVLLYTNVVMVVFNMIPAFPMDGGRMLRSLLAIWLSHHRATAIAAVIGQALAVLMAAVGIFHNPFLILIGIMVFAGAKTENQSVSLRYRLEGRCVRDFMQEAATLDVHDSIREGVQSIYRTGREDFVVMDGPVIVGILPGHVWMKHLQDNGDCTAGRLMKRPMVMLPAEMPAYAMIRLVNSSGQSVFPVIRDGRLAGVIVKDTIRQVLRGEFSGKKEVSGSREALAQPRSFIDVG